MDPTRLELVTSAMRGRSEGFAAVHYRSKNRLDKPNPRIGPPRMFAIVRTGCRQIVVSCISKYRASMETLFIDRQAYSRLVHVVLEDSVQEVQERMSCRQQTGSMQDPAYGLLRIPLAGTSVNKPAIPCPHYPHGPLPASPSPARGSRAQASPAHPCGVGLPAEGGVA